MSEKMYVSKSVLLELVQSWKRKSSMGGDREAYEDSESGRVKYVEDRAIAEGWASAANELLDVIRLLEVNRRDI